MADMTRINANLPTKLVTVAKHYANLNGMTLTELIRNGLKEHLISQGKQAQQMTINMQAAPSHHAVHVHTTAVTQPEVQ